MAQVIGGRFEIGDVLGQGGMGTVFQGIDLQTGQHVAIKLLRPDVIQDNPDLVARFEREGEALRRLNHPNIVKMLATVDQDNSHYIVMEYVTGSLQDLLDDTANQTTPLPIAQILHIALELADALSRAHHLKIIHRDIKPSNVLLTDDGAPRLTDFGIARLDDHTRMTESGLVVGTFAYLSPEACAGLDLDARTDIWSFGVMLYEMLTGIRPFSEDSMAATVTAILNKAPADVRTLRPDTPPALADLITRMLEKDRDQRLTSMRQVGAELEAIARGDTTPAQRKFTTPTPTSTIDSPLEQITSGAVKPVWRRTRALIIGGTGIIALMIVLFITLNSVCCVSTPILTSVPALSADGKYMVLIAPFNQVRTETRDVQRLIADDLRQQFEVEAPYSKLRVQTYPDPITTDEEALRAAEITGASVVIWGNYTADTITANIQLGVLTAFKYNTFERDVLERTANVQVALTDETKQSLAPNVLAVLGVMHNADGDLYGISRILVLLDILKTLTPGELIGDATAVHVHRYFSNYSENPNKAIDELTLAINGDGGNALLYGFRAQAYFRLGLTEGTRQMETRNDDAGSTQRLGPSNWILPLALVVGSVDNSLEFYNRMIELRPDDWYLYYQRAAQYVYLVNAQNNSSFLEKARQDIDQALAMNPDVMFPQALAANIALSQGRITDASVFANDIIVNIEGDTFFTSHLLLIQWDLFTYHPSVMYAPFSKFLIGQSQEALQIIQQQLAGGENYSDLILTGLIQCDLGNLDQALLAFRKSENPDNNFVANLLEASIYMEQNNVKEANRQIVSIQRSNQGDLLAPFAAAVLNEEFGCQDIFDSEKIRQIEAKYGNLTAGDLSITLTAIAPTATASLTTTLTP